MATEAWKGSLAGAAAKVLRSLGWTSAGGLDLRFADKPQLIPIAIADDATRPGANMERGRRFSQVLGPFADLDDADWITVIVHDSPTGVIIDEMWVAMEQQAEAVTSDFAVRQFPPGQDLTTGSLVLNKTGYFTEGLRTVSDFSPILEVSGLYPTEVPFPTSVPLWHQPLNDLAGTVTAMSAHRVPLNVYLGPPTGADPRAQSSGGLVLLPGGEVGEGFTGGYIVTLFGRVF